MPSPVKWRVFAAVVLGLFALAVSINWYRRARLEREVKTWEQIALHTTSQDEVDEKLQQLAGKGAAYCGQVNYRHAELAIKCALFQFSEKKPFYLRIYRTGIDNWGSTSFAGDQNGKLYYVKSGSRPVSLDRPQANARFFDNRLAVVVPCPMPIPLRAYNPESPQLTVLDPPPDPWWIRWSSNIMTSTQRAAQKTDPGGLLTCFPVNQEP